MPELTDNCVALVVTSPPYFAGKAYEEALGEGHIPGDYAEYLEMLHGVFSECVRVLEPGGRIAVNVANLGRKPYRSLSADVITILSDLGLLLRGEVLWQKAKGAGGNCAWGSFQRPTNPVIRDLTERVIIASKGRFDRALDQKKRLKAGLPHVATLQRDEFMEATTDLWEIAPERATKVGHPAPFPVELPERLIHLYTYREDLVLDPFMGSGTTAVAAVRTGRHFVGYDTDEHYVHKALLRIDAARQVDGSGSEGSATSGVHLLPGSSSSSSSTPDAESPTTHRSAMREGRAARDLAHQLLEENGFTVTNTKVTVASCGVDVSFEAKDALGRIWLFDVAGGFTAIRPGLERNEVLWKAIAKGAVLHGADPTTNFVVLAAGLASGQGAKALQHVVGAGQPIRAVIDLSRTDDVERLRDLASTNEE